MSLTQNNDEVTKNPWLGFLLSFFGGTLGLHKFYFGKFVQGFVYAFFWFTFIPALLGIIEAFFVYKKIKTGNRFPKIDFKRSITLIMVALITSYFFYIWTVGFIHSELKPDNISEYRQTKFKNDLDDKIDGLSNFTIRFFDLFKKERQNKLSTLFSERHRTKINNKFVSIFKTKILESEYFSLSHSYKISADQGDETEWLMLSIDGVNNQDEKIFNIKLILKVKNKNFLIDGLRMDDYTFETNNKEIRKILGII